MATANQIRQACDLLRNEVRYKILREISREGEVSGQDLIRLLRGKCSAPMVYQSIGVIRHAHVISTRSVGQENFYSLNRANPVTQWIENTLDNETKVGPGRPRKVFA